MTISLKLTINKKVSLVLILISLTALCTVIIKPMFITGVPSAKALTENVATSAFISVEPNPVGVGQVMRVDGWVEPAPPTSTDVFYGLIFTVTKPDGAMEVLGPFISYPNGSMYFWYTPDQVGTYRLHLNYSGQYFANRTIWYEPSMSPTVALTVTSEPVRVPQIRIKADGSISPPTAPISTTDNVTYTLTDDIYFNFSDYLTGGLRVERNNIVINGAGHTLRGLNAGYGIALNSPYFPDQSSVTIANSTIMQFDTGIYVVSSFNTIIGNNITSNYDGIVLDSSSVSNNISENTLTNNYQGIYVSFASNNNSVSANNITHNQLGLNVYSSDNSISHNDISNNYVDGLTVGESSNKISSNTIANNSVYGFSIYSGNSVLRNNSMNNNGYNFASGGANDVDVSNTVNGKPIYYWVKKQELTVPADAGYVALINCTNITVQGLTLTNNGQGILLQSTTNTKIVGNTLTNNDYCLHVESSNYNNISANNIANNSLGFYIESSNHNNISANNIANNLQGLYVDSSNYNNISANNIENNQNYGLNIFSSSYNDISSNNITNSYFGLTIESIDFSSISKNNITNNNCGVYVSSASNNTLYHNNFINNTQQAYSDLPSSNNSNSWDDGYPSGGNYWSDYNGTDANGDGIGDTPYVFPENSTDRYPLMKPFGTKTSPSPSPSPSPSQSPSQNPSPSPSPSPSPTPSTSPSPSPSPSPSTSEQPTHSPQPQPATPQTELVYAIAVGLAVITIIAVTAVALKKKRQKSTS